LNKLIVIALLLFSAGAQADLVTLNFNDPSIPESGNEFNLDGLNFFVDPVPNPPAYVVDSENQIGFCPDCVVTVTDLGTDFASGYDAFFLQSIEFLTFPSDYTVRLTVDYARESRGTEIIDLLASDGLHTLNLWGIESLTIDSLGTGPTIISSMTVDAIPVPAAVWLFGSALGLLGWVRRSVSPSGSCSGNK